MHLRRYAASPRAGSGLTAVADDDRPIFAVICCGTRLRQISIDSTRLAFAHCSRCDTSRWFADGLPLDRTSAIVRDDSEPSSTAKGQC